MSEPWEDIDPKNISEETFRVINILSFRRLASMIQGVTDNWGHVCGKVDGLEGRVKTLENGNDIKKVKITSKWQFWAAVFPSLLGLGVVLGRFFVK